LPHAINLVLTLEERSRPGNHRRSHASIEIVATRGMFGESMSAVALACLTRPLRMKWVATNTDHRRQQAKAVGLACAGRQGFCE
jgi:hypothetical protein